MCVDCCAAASTASARRLLPDGRELWSRMGLAEMSSTVKVKPVRSVSSVARCSRIGAVPPAAELAKDGRPSARTSMDTHGHVSSPSRRHSGESLLTKTLAPSTHRTPAQGLGAQNWPSMHCV